MTNNWTKIYNRKYDPPLGQMTDARYFVIRGEPANLRRTQHNSTEPRGDSKSRHQARKRNFSCSLPKVSIVVLYCVSSPENLLIKLFLAVPTEEPDQSLRFNATI